MYIGGCASFSFRQWGPVTAPLSLPLSVVSVTQRVSILDLHESPEPGGPLDLSTIIW